MTTPHSQQGGSGSAWQGGMGRMRWWTAASSTNITITTIMKPRHSAHEWGSNNVFIVWAICIFFSYIISCFILSIIYATRAWDDPMWTPQKETYDSAPGFIINIPALLQTFRIYYQAYKLLQIPAKSSHVWLNSKICPSDVHLSCQSDVKTSKILTDCQCQRSDLSKMTGFREECPCPHALICQIWHLSDEISHFWSILTISPSRIVASLEGNKFILPPSHTVVLGYSDLKYDSSSVRSQLSKLTSTGNSSIDR